METQKAREVLERAKEGEKIVCLYTNPYSDKFAAGFVEAVSENHVVLRHITVHGRYDGWLLRALDDICRIDYGGRYEETLLSLYRGRAQSHLDNFLSVTDQIIDLKSEMLLCAQRNDFAVSIDTGSDEDNWGFVKVLEAITVTIERFNLHGQIDSESVFDMEYIQKIGVDNEDLQDLKLLAHWRDL